jgi:hypothetical protein
VLARHTLRSAGELVTHLALWRARIALLLRLGARDASCALELV